jgi:uncharacterized membrane protein YgdD (TMEM256/DUF423 family)
MNKSENESNYWVIYGALWVAFSILLGAAGKHVLMADGAVIRAENLNTASQFGMIMGLSLMVLSALRWMRFWSAYAPWPERLVGTGLFLFSGGLAARSLAPESMISDLMSPCIPCGGVLLSAGFFLAAIQTIALLYVKNDRE